MIHPSTLTVGQSTWALSAVPFSCVSVSHQSIPCHRCDKAFLTIFTIVAATFPLLVCLHSRGRYRKSSPQRHHLVRRWKSPARDQPPNPPPIRYGPDKKYVYRPVVVITTVTTAVAYLLLAAPPPHSPAAQPRWCSPTFYSCQIPASSVGRQQLHECPSPYPADVCKKNSPRCPNPSTILEHLEVPALRGQRSPGRGEIQYRNYLYIDEKGQTRRRQKGSRLHLTGPANSPRWLGPSR